MTHNQIIDAIDRQIVIAPTFALGGYVVWLHALRAVVEMHKPFMYDGRFGQFERCSGCASEEEWLGEIYPCPTIQAIQKELVTNVDNYKTTRRSDLRFC